MIKKCGYAKTAYDPFNFYKIKDNINIFHVQLLSDPTTLDVCIDLTIIQFTYTLFHKVKVEPHILNDKNKFIEFLLEVKKKYIDDEEYLIKCCKENKRKEELEKDFK